MGRPAMSADHGSSRREVLGALGVAAAAKLAAPSEATAQGEASLKIVDFHNHYISPGWTMTNLARVPEAARAAQEKKKKTKKKNTKKRRALGIIRSGRQH